MPYNNIKKNNNVNYSYDRRTQYRKPSRKSYQKPIQNGYRKPNRNGYRKPIQNDYQKPSRRIVSINNPFFMVVLTIFVLLALFVVSNVIVGDISKIVEIVRPSDNKVYYYEKERSERYKAYAKANAELSEDEVIWHVNADLDLPHYKKVNNIPVVDNDFVLVNKHNALPKDFVPDDLVTLPGGEKLKSYAAEALIKMQQDAKNDGEEFLPRSGYRSAETQNDLYNGYLRIDPQETVDTYSAKPRYSEHQLALAMDLNVPNGDKLAAFTGTSQADWVAKNCYKYGFIVRYTEENKHITGYMAEPWHVRYVGIDVATQIRELGFTSYEEYYVKYIQHSPPE